MNRADALKKAMEIIGLISNGASKIRAAVKDSPFPSIPTVRIFPDGRVVLSWYGKGGEPVEFLINLPTYRYLKSDSISTIDIRIDFIETREKYEKRMFPSVPEDSIKKEGEFVFGGVMDDGSQFTAILNPLSNGTGPQEYP